MKTILKGLWFTILSALIFLSYFILIFFWHQNVDFDWWLVPLGLMLSSASAYTIVFSNKVISKKGQVGIAMVEALPDLIAIREPTENEILRVAIVRQSGNEQRAFGTDMRDDAISECLKVFSRKQTDKVRVWHNTDMHFDARITYHHGRGTKEGKVIRGLTFEIMDRSKFQTL